MSEMLLMYLILFLVFNLIIYDKPPLINDITKVTNRYNGLILYLLYNQL